MRSWRSVLVGTDFSEGAGHAVARAAGLAASLDCERGTLLHVQEGAWLAALGSALGSSAPHTHELERALAEQLTRVADDALREHGFRLDPEIATGAVAAELARLAATHDAVVLGAQGAHRIKERLLGSLPQRVLGRIDKPLLVVRRPPSGPYARVVLGVDFSDDSRRAAELVATLLPDAALHVVHAFRYAQELAMHYASVTPDVIAEYRQRDRERSEAQLLRFIAATGIPQERLTYRIEDGDPALALCRRAAATEAELIVVGKRGTSAAEDLLFGSVVQRLFGEAPCDVLVSPHA